MVEKRCFVFIGGVSYYFEQRVVKDMLFVYLVIVKILFSVRCWGYKNSIKLCNVSQCDVNYKILQVEIIEVCINFFLVRSLKLCF